MDKADTIHTVSSINGTTFSVNRALWDFGVATFSWAFILYMEGSIISNDTLIFSF